MFIIFIEVLLETLGRPDFLPPIIQNNIDNYLQVKQFRNINIGAISAIILLWNMSKFLHPTGISWHITCIFSSYPPNIKYIL